MTLGSVSAARILCRKVSPKTIAISIIAFSIFLCIYYANSGDDERTNNRDQDTMGGTSGDNFNGGNAKGKSQALKSAADSEIGEGGFFGAKSSPKLVKKRGRVGDGMDTCPKLSPADADVNTVEIFRNFDFQPTWMKNKEYWDKTFEDRFERQKMDADRPPLKVFIVPHSHNDPGWLKTFENYYHYSSRQIMNHMVSKLQQYKNLTFIWSEMAFLNAWWEEAHPSKQRALRHLVESGRLEITTGGWVMTDEANAHVFAMVDQLIEGHQWIMTNLGVKPTSGWSVDPFGHGSTQPYIMSVSGIKGAVIQRIHYAWKQWLALKQYGDFRWVPAWSPSAHGATLLTHNQPFDIYSIKHSCGPHPYICLNFDFRKVTGEYTEFSIKSQPITEKNVKEKSELLLEQYARTGSLFPHNVVLMPLGDDFRYNVAEEWDQQYTNYIKLIDYINAHKNAYKTEISFGTPRDYFTEIVKRYDQYPTLKGDFFVYSDIFSEGRPAYWSGYYTTRPFMKILDRELEHSLRSAEIVYTAALNRARQKKLLPYLKVLERDFEKLVRARRNLALFQHHDAITGTSKSFVMRDYGLKLFEGIRDTVKIQENSIRTLIFPDSVIKPGVSVLLSDTERDSYEKLPRKTTINIGGSNLSTIRRVILYNSLAQVQEQLVHLRVNTSTVKVTDGEGRAVVFQINPVLERNGTTKQMWISADEFDVTFLARLKGLSLSFYTVEYSDKGEGELATVYCNKCSKKTLIEGTTTITRSKFKVKAIPPGDVQLENSKIKVLFNGLTGFMKSVTRKHNPRKMQCALQFAAYKSAQFHSGAYLFKTDPNEHEIEKDVLLQYKEEMNIVITSGPVSSDITVVYGAFLTHTVTILHSEISDLSGAIFIENIVDFESPPKNRETELFMRVVSDVQNGEPPEFYTDQNGFQMQKRVKVDKIEIEGNYFPITTMAFIQDESTRLSLLTNHAQGAASWQPGFLEVMLDRRTLYDDARGMGEGLVDNKRTVHKLVLVIEDRVAAKDEKQGVKRFENDDNFEKGDVLRSFNIPTEVSGAKQDSYPLPSHFANTVSNNLNYPVSIFILDEDQIGEARDLQLINKFPCDVHLMNLRMQPDSVYSQFPSSSALLVLHRQGYDCGVGNFSIGVCDQASFDGVSLNFADLKSVEGKTLTGIDKLEGEQDLDLGDIYLDSMTLKTYNLTFV